MLMVMFMKGSGRTIRLMGRDSIHIQMDLDMRESGERTSSMDKELRGGLMEHVIRGNILMERSMERENSYGLITAPTLETFLTIIYRELEFMNGLMEEYSMVIGKIIRCKDMELLPGLMEGGMWVNTLMI